MSSRSLGLSLAALLSISATACGWLAVAASPETDAGSGAQAADAGADAGSDAQAADAGADAGSDAQAADAGADAGSDAQAADAGADAGPSPCPKDLPCPAVYSSVMVTGPLAIPADDAGASDDPLASLTITFCIEGECVEYVRAASQDAEWQSLFCDAGAGCPHTYAFSETTNWAEVVWLTATGPDTYTVTAGPLLQGFFPDASTTAASVTFALDAGTPAFSQTTSSMDCQTYYRCCGPTTQCTITLH